MGFYLRLKIAPLQLYLYMTQSAWGTWVSCAYVQENGEMQSGIKHIMGAIALQYDTMRDDVHGTLYKNMVLASMT